jgi:TonB family protein
MSLRSLRLLLSLSAFGVSPILGQQAQEPKTPLGDAVVYPNSLEGLQSQIGEILGAIKEKNSAKEVELIHRLVMPEDSTWFVDEYGPGFGTSLAAAYRRALPSLEEEIRLTYEANAQSGKIHPKILRYADPAETESPIDHFLNSMNKIEPLYETAFLGDRPMFQMSLKPAKGKAMPCDLNGYFVHVDGSFRFIPAEVMMRLPNERPVRIHLDMNVMKSKLITRVDPRYPEEAIRKHIGGKVAVRLELGRDGRIQEAKAISGDPILSQAFLDAVRQWQFLPTQLDGDPVEVELDVEMVFEMH